MADDAPESGPGASRGRAAVPTATDLSSRVLPGVAVGLLTGRMSAAEKDGAMERFRSGETQVLVCTTVVEVGVDVPNATVMLVHDADRFGLATLHQLRGRVGRGEAPGRVFLETRARRGTPARRRLEALESTSDGMELAQLDLELRHEGDVLGCRQHGVTLRTVDLVADADLVEAAHEDAARVAGEDPGLAGDGVRALALEVRRRFSSYFEEMEGR